MEYTLRWILPFAVLFVVVVLGAGLFNMLRGGNPNLSQKLMRARVLLQFVALLIAMAIAYLAGNRP
ncbi:MAG: twin transmembrane helix small protein [Pseudomonadota bacterium]